MIQYTILFVLLSAASMATCNKHLESYFQLPAEADQDLLHLLADDALMSSGDLSAEFKRRSGENVLFAELASLSDMNDATCSNGMTQTVIDIFALINQRLGAGEDREFVNTYSPYLQQHGAQKFARCAASTAEKFAEVQVDSTAESALDKLVGDSGDDQKLYESAQSFEGDASQVAGECAKLQGSLKHIFDVYNLARILAKSGAKPLPIEVPARFLKLNEYNRICLQ